MDPEPQPPRTQPDRVGRIITNLIKLGGLIVVLAPVFRGGEPTTTTIAGAAFMMAGAQGIETFLTSFFGGAKK
jgi:hypothetical protein